MSQSPVLGIVVGGGPAPGINGVIAAAAIEAINEGCRVIGIYDGYHWLSRGDTSRTIELHIEDVSRIHLQGGSILRTSRTNIATNPELVSNTVAALARLGVTHLLCIGGDGTTYGASKVAAAAGGTLCVATAPKTIDNDLPLPDDMPTFGFETARAVGTNITESLMEDARTMTRWYLVVTMGRKSGALALGICRAAGATVAVIPEQFDQPKIGLRRVTDVIIGSIIKRRAAGQRHGVAIIAEGVAECLDESEAEVLRHAARDAYGFVRLSEIDLGHLLGRAVAAALDELKLPVTIVTKDIGYELRCAKPVAFDVDYSRTLGYGAVRYLLSGGSGAMVTLRGGRVTPVPLHTIIDESAKRLRTRLVDTSTEAYEVSCKYMIRLEPSDFVAPRLETVAAAANMQPAAFVERFGQLAEVAARR